MGLRIIGCRWRIGLGRIVFFPCGSGPGLRGRTGSFRGKLYSSRGRIASFPRRKVSNCWCLVVRGTLTILIAYWIWIYWVTCCIIIIASLVINGTVTFWRRVDSCRGRVSPSLGGRRAVAGVGLQELGGDWNSLFKVMLLVIFPSFFDTKWFSLLICLCLTLLNLSSLTLLMKCWHCSNLSCEMIEASLALQSCVSLSNWTKMLLIALILACNKSFSAFLIICLAFGVSKVDFNLILTGINSLWIHLRRRFYGSCSLKI